MKKLLVFLFLCSLFRFETIAQSGNTGPLAWVVHEGVLTIYGEGQMPDYEPVVNNTPWSDEEIIIEEIVIAEGVTSIGDYAFLGLDRVLSVTISGTVKTIGDFAFFSCTSLPSVIIPPSVTSIGTGAFAFCNGLLSVSIPHSIVTISNAAFSASGLISVTIPSSVTTIGYQAFNTCTQLTSVTIPASVTHIDAKAFGYCHNLTELINLSLEPQILSEAFEGIDLSAGSLLTRTLRVPAPSVTQYSLAEEWEDFVNIVAFNAEIRLDQTRINFMDVTVDAPSIDIIATVTGEVTSPDVIMWSSDNPEVATVDYTGKVKPLSSGKTVITAAIGSIETTCEVTIYEHGGVDIPIVWGILDGVLTITGNGAIPDYISSENPPPWFSYRNMITSIEISEGITHIGNWAFSDCSNLTSVTFPNTLVFIGYSAFRACINLTSVAFPQTVTIIEVEAFWNCVSLTSVTIPYSVTDINNTAFLNCSKLSEINVDANNMAYTSVDGVLFNKDENTLVIYPCGRPNSHYDIPATVSFVGYNAFVNCTGLSSITFPNSVTSVGACAFWGCINLTEIVNAAPEPQIIDVTVFSGISFSDCLLRVPAASVGDYRDSEGWKEFANIVPLDSKFTLNNDEIYLLTGATATLTASVADEVSGVITVLWNSSHPDVATVDAAGTVTAIKVGTTVITSSFGSMEATCIVTVIQLGQSSIKGTINNSGTENVRVNLYIKAEETGQTKRGIVGGYVLLATTVPNGNGEYSFENLPEGNYQIQVEIEDYEPEATDEIVLSGEETYSDINFIVEEGRIMVDTDISTSAEAFFAPDLKAYPNPFTDMLHITGMAVETWHVASLRVINTAGTVVHTQTITNPDETIHLGHLPAGMYFIRFENGGRVTVIKAVKQ